jgi:threonine dehydrogenase-like Zn-dependent dehydrogenase
MDGCLAEFFILPERNCFLLPDPMAMTEAALVEPLSIAVYALEMWGGILNQSVGILGSGPIGLCVLISARSLGIHKIFMTDKVEERIHAALNAGALWAGNPDKQDIVTEILKWQPEGLDAVFACCGDPAAFDQGTELLKPGGKLFILGIPLAERVSFNISQLRRKEIAIQNVRRQNRVTEKAIHLIASRYLDVAFLVTHKFRLEEAQEAFETAASYKNGILKAMIAFD